MGNASNAEGQIPKMAGPSGGRILTCKFSINGSTVVQLEGQGCSVARTAADTYVITTKKSYKSITPQVHLRRPAGAALNGVSVYWTADTLNSITLQQLTSSTGVAAGESISNGVVSVSLLCRANS